MAAYRQVDGLKSPAGRLPVHRDQLHAQRSVTSIGSLYFLLFTVNVCVVLLYSFSKAWRQLERGHVLTNSIVSSWKYCQSLHSRFEV